MNSHRERLEALRAAKQELERRVEHRYETERERYEEKMEQRREKERRDGRKPKEPALEQLEEVRQLVGEANNLVADAGYYSKKNVEACRKHGIKPVISMRNTRRGQESEGKPSKPVTGAASAKNTAVDEMKEFLETDKGKALYARRKSTVEPMFGVIKHVLGFRQFLMRGIKAVSREWSLVCIGYNLKKMFVLKTQAGRNKVKMGKLVLTHT